MMDERLKRQANQSSEKLLSVFEKLILQGEPLRLIDLAEMVDMKNSTTSRFLTALINKGYVEQDKETLRYYPTYKICALADRVRMHMDLREIARPYMKQLSRIFGESACMSVEDHMHAVYIEIIRETNQRLMMVQNVGNEVPMHCTGNGKLLLLNYSDQDLDRLIRIEGLTKYTDNTITTKDDLKKELVAIRKRGYAFDNEEREVGTRCLAFPIYNSAGKIAAGLSVTGPVSRMTDEEIAPKLDEFRNISLEISRKLGYQVFETEENENG